MTTVFRDGQILETNGFPSIKITGLSIGDRKMFYKNILACVDRKHGWKAVIFFDYGEKKGLFTSDKTVPKDLIEGIIYVPT